MSERPLVIGVCGGIGSGKSVVRRVLGLLLDCPTYDCDTRAKALYQAPAVRAEITSLLHEDPIDQDGRLKKELLSSALHDEHLGHYLRESFMRLSGRTLPNGLPS